jgi:multiple sugar transport system permease protein
MKGRSVAVATSHAHAAARRRRRGAFRTYLPAYLFLLPNFLGVLIFIAFPVFFALYMSFQEWNGANPPHFIGLGNFQDLLADPVFWQSVGNTFVYTLLTVPIGVAFSLGVAVLLNQSVRGLAFFRAAMFVPVVTSALAVAVIWKWIYDYDNGLINDLLSVVNLPQVPWLTANPWPMIGLAIIGVWKSFGLTAIILLAALQGVSAAVLEAAAIDGAGAWRRFRSVTLPLIAPSMLFVTITTFINSFQVFDQIYYMTNGGPNYGTTVLNFLVFQRAFQQNRFGAASAVAYIMFAIIFVITLVQLRVGRRFSNAASEFDV